jgi:hypothetical protein
VNVLDFRKNNIRHSQSRVRRRGAGAAAPAIRVILWRIHVDSDSYSRPIPDACGSFCVERFGSPMSPLVLQSRTLGICPNGTFRRSPRTSSTLGQGPTLFHVEH